MGMVGAACVGVWVFASSVGFFRGAARLAAYVLVTHGNVLHILPQIQHGANSHAGPRFQCTIKAAWDHYS